MTENHNDRPLPASRWVAQTSTSDDPWTFGVHPDRLVSATYDQDAEAYTGEGDIIASYSGDRIGMDQQIRKPFTWRGALCVCTSLSGARGPLSATAYKLVEQSAFDGEPLTYAEKTRDSEDARRDPYGFYHGMIVQWRGAEFVLCGPPMRFVADIDREPSLFAATHARQAQR